MIRFANDGGNVLGICNGFQILCESGLLPGALLRNEKQQFICKNIYLKDPNEPKSKILKIPIAHGEGRYYAGDTEMEVIKNNGQILYQYCTKEGEITAAANPNGAMDNIAGIRNIEGNVFGMMPHPERACSNALNNTDGRFMFQRLFGIGDLAAVHG